MRIFPQQNQTEDYFPLPEVMGAAISFSLGFLLYPLMEIAYRGFTHISMAVCGGLAMLFFFYLSHFPLSHGSRAFLGTCFILILELLTGLIVNLWLDLQVWDYSHLFFQYCGQISLFYAVIWFVLSYFFLPITARIWRNMYRIFPQPAKKA